MLITEDFTNRPIVFGNPDVDQITQPLQPYVSVCGPTAALLSVIHVYMYSAVVPYGALAALQVILQIIAQSKRLISVIKTERTVGYDPDLQ